MATIDPKLIVGVALIAPFVYTWMKIDFKIEVSILILAGIAFWAWNTFDNQFVHKSELERKQVPQLGPQQPFVAAEPSWEIGTDGTPIPKYHPPYQQYPAGQRGPR